MVRYNSKNDIGLLSEIPKRLLRNSEIIYGDLRDYDAINHIVKDVDVIFHLGALIAIPYSYKCPKNDIDTNVLGTFNILNAARNSSIDKIIHTSTSEVYGTAFTYPLMKNIHCKDNHLIQQAKLVQTK